MNISFGAPWVLLLLLVIPALFVSLRLRDRQTRYSGLRYPSAGLADTRAKSWRVSLRPLLMFTRLIAIALLIIALARPQAGEARETLRGEGVDIVIALDISDSMRALDFVPQNRLEAAKSVISNFINERPYDRIGLAVFAGESFTQSPPTIDHTVLYRQLRDVRFASDLGLPRGTAIGLGLASAASMLKDSNAKSKVITLLSDGGNNAGEIDPMTVAIAAQALGIKVYTIGIGRPGETSEVPSQSGFRAGPQFNMDEEDVALLQEIARTTGAKFYLAGDTDELQRIYDDINALEKSEVEVNRFTIHYEMAAWLILPALLLLAIEMAMRHSTFRKVP